MKNIIGASILLAALASAPAFAQSGPSSPSGPSGPFGTNVDNISTVTVGNIITVTISLDAGGTITVSGAEGGGETTTSARTATGGAVSLSAAALIARIEAAIAQLTGSAGAGGGPAILLLNGLLAQLKGSA